MEGEIQDIEREIEDLDWNVIRMNNFKPIRDRKKMKINRKIYLGEKKDPIVNFYGRLGKDIPLLSSA